MFCVIWSGVVAEGAGCRKHLDHKVFDNSVESGVLVSYWDTSLAMR